MATIRRRLWRFSFAGSIAVVMGASTLAAQPLIRCDVHYRVILEGK